jgi:O-antigen/teichoic acid export membrane protein
VKFFVGKNYWEGLPIVPILLLANWFLGIYYNLTVWYKLTNKTGYGAGISIFGAVLTIVFNIILIPYLGYYGAAWTTLICYSSMMILSFYQGQKHFPINYNVKKIIGYIILSVALYLLSNFFNEFALPIKLIMNTIILIVFLIIVWLNEKSDLLALKN